MNKYLIVVPALMIAFGTLHIVEQRRQDAKLAQVRSDVASLSTAMASADREVAANARAQRVVQVVAAPASPGRGPESAPGRERPDAEVEPAQQQGRRTPDVATVRDRLEATFGQEPTDPEWTREAQSIADAKLPGVIPETSAVRAIECRASMCRIESIHQDPDTYRRFVESALVNPDTKLWNGGFFSTILGEPEDGKLSIVTYLAHEGEALPPMEQL